MVNLFIESICSTQMRKAAVRAPLANSVRKLLRRIFISGLDASRFSFLASAASWSHFAPRALASASVFTHLRFFLPSNITQTSYPPLEGPYPLTILPSRLRFRTAGTQAGMEGWKAVCFHQSNGYKTQNSFPVTQSLSFNLWRHHGGSILLFSPAGVQLARLVEGGFNLFNSEEIGVPDFKPQILLA